MVAGLLGSSTIFWSMVTVNWSLSLASATPLPSQTLFPTSYLSFPFSSDPIIFSFFSTSFISFLLLFHPPISHCLPYSCFSPSYLNPFFFQYPPPSQSSNIGHVPKAGLLSVIM